MKLVGKHRHVSREFVRAWLHASAAVLAYHGRTIDLATLEVRVKSMPAGEDGAAYPDANRIELDRDTTPEVAASTVLHEVIHLACGTFCEDDDTRDSDEKCTSTLTSKLKPEVAPIAQLLLDGTYKRAAYIAHTKISYRNEPGQPDYYDSTEDDAVGVKDKHRRKA
jgi:hypothetical protein